MPTQKSRNYLHFWKKVKMTAPYYAVLSAPGIGHPEQCTASKCPAKDSLYYVQEYLYPVQETLYPVQETMYPV
jgi:hypothetical protein